MLAVVLTAMVTGCATLDENQCRVGDWYGIGFNDGVAGRTLQRLAEHQKACAKFNIAIDREPYMRGYEKGLERYCEPSNGYRLGRNGQTYNGVCTGAQGAAFLAQYREGRRIYDLEAELEGIDDEIREIEQRLDDPKTTKEEIKDLVYKLRMLERRRISLDLELSTARRPYEDGPIYFQDY